MLSLARNLQHSAPLKLRENKFTRKRLHQPINIEELTTKPIVKQHSIIGTSIFLIGKASCASHKLGNQHSFLKKETDNFSQVLIESGNAQQGEVDVVGRHLQIG